MRADRRDPSWTCGVPRSTRSDAAGSARRLRAAIPSREERRVRGVGARVHLRFGRRDSRGLGGRRPPSRMGGAGVPRASSSGERRDVPRVRSVCVLSTRRADPGRDAARVSVLAVAPLHVRLPHADPLATFLRRDPARRRRQPRAISSKAQLRDARRRHARRASADRSSAATGSPPADPSCRSSSRRRGPRCATT